MTDTPEEPEETPAPPMPAEEPMPAQEQQADPPPAEPEHIRPEAPPSPPVESEAPPMPRPQPSPPSVNPPPRASEPMAPAPMDAASPGRRVPWIPILIVAAVVIALALGFVAFRWVAGDAVDETAYVVEPYAPTTELITGRDRVEAHAEPDTSSRIVVIFGEGVTLNVSGRVSRGLGNDWYAVSWNDQTAFVRTQDVVPGSGAPPAPIVRERPPPEEVKDEKPEEMTEPEEEQAAEAPRASGALGVGDVNWVREPNARDFARFFPDDALDAGQSGNVTLSCIIGGSGRLACSVASESPGGFGFGQAAIGISRQLRVRTTLPDGSSAEGREMQLPLSFRTG